MVFSRISFGSPILLNEGSRKEYVDFLEEVKGKQGIEVYAYSVFSDCAFMLTAKFGEYTLKDAARDQKEILDHFLEYGTAEGSEVEAFRKGPGVSCLLCHLRSGKEVVDTVIHIHLRAMNEGIVQHGLDYWWTSAKEYKARSYWGGVDVTAVLAVLSPDFERARRNLIRKHHERERDLNPEPACLSHLTEIREFSGEAGEDAANLPSCSDDFVTNIANDGIKGA